LPVPSFQLRSASQSDFPSIRNLIQLVRINPTSLDWRRFLVAISPEGDVIGCGQIKPHREGSFELASIAVHPDWRGIGIAKAIIERLIASHSGLLFLTYRASLGEFYKNFGFSVVKPGKMPPHFLRITRLVSFFRRVKLLEEDLLVMTLLIEKPSP